MEQKDMLLLGAICIVMVIAIGIPLSSDPVTIGKNNNYLCGITVFGSPIVSCTTPNDNFTFTHGSGITITSFASNKTIFFNASKSSGESTTVSNLAGSFNWFSSLVGSNINLRGLNLGLGLSGSQNNNTVTLQTNFGIDNYSCPSGYAPKSFNNQTRVTTCQAIPMSNGTSSGENTTITNLHALGITTTPSSQVGGNIKLRGIENGTGLLGVENSTTILLSLNGIIPDGSCSSSQKVLAISKTTGAVTCATDQVGIPSAFGNNNQAGGVPIYTGTTGSQQLNFDVLKNGTNITITHNSSGIFVSSATISAIQTINGNGNSAQTIQGSNLNVTVSSSAGITTINIGSGVVTKTGAQTLTSKTIDANSNTLTNIANASIANGANIGWSKISKSGSILNDIGSPTSSYSFGSQKITSLGTPTLTTDAERTDHIGLNLISIGACTDGQAYVFQGSNSTMICKTVITSAVTSITGSLNNITASSSTGAVTLNIGSNVVTKTGAQTLTSKTIDAGSNTISNLADANIASGANIGWTKISKSGSVLNDIGSPSSSYSLGSQRLTSLGTPTLSTDVQRVDHIGLNLISIGTCLDGQGYVFQSSNSTMICKTIQTGSDNDPAPKVSINGNNRTTFTNIATTNATGNNIAGHTVTFPQNATGTLCTRNQTGTCGTNSGVTSISGTPNNVTASASTGAVTLNLGSNAVVTNGNAQNFTSGKKIQTTPSSSTSGFNLGSSSSDITSPRRGDLRIIGPTIKYNDNTNTTQSICTSSNGLCTTGGITTINSQSASGTNMNLVEISTGNLTIINATGKISFGTGNNLGYIAKSQSWTGTNTYNNGTLVIRGNGHGATISSQTQTVNATYKLPASNIATNTLALQPALNATQPSDPASTTSTTGVMTGLLATFTPQVTGRIQLVIEGDLGSSAAADGAKVDGRTGTGASPSNGAVLSGTVCGKAVQVTAVGINANREPFTLTCQITGLTLGTKIWIEMGQYAITAGTASVTNISITIMEI